MNSSTGASSITIRTLGHGARDVDGFLALCRGAGLAAVVDVRRYPGSRRHPHFGRDAMSAWLAEAGLAYRWLPALGGRRAPAPDSRNTALRNPQFRGYADHMGSEEFRRGCAELLRVTRPGVMCAESLWWHCHRRLLADHLVLVSRTPVEHVLPDGRVAGHEPTAGARVDGDRVVYELEVQPPLFDDP